MPQSEAPKAGPTRLRPGDLAPELSAIDIYGRDISLRALRGKPILLSFHRFAKCPFCNLRIHQVIGRYPAYSSAGLAVIAIFESSLENVRNGVGAQEPPFSLIADSERQFYTIFGIERSALGLAKGLINRMSDARESIAMGLVKPIQRDGTIFRLPADFLIAPDGKIHDAYYGNDIGDHLPFECIDEFLKIHGQLSSPASLSPTRRPSQF